MKILLSYGLLAIPLKRDPSERDIVVVLRFWVWTSDTNKKQILYVVCVCCSVMAVVAVPIDRNELVTVP
jgi:hypothetical protein